MSDNHYNYNRNNYINLYLSSYPSSLGVTGVRRASDTYPKGLTPLSAAAVTN